MYCLHLDLSKGVADALAWLLPSREAAAASSSHPASEAEGMEELRKLERRMKSIWAMLEDAEVKWDAQDAAAKLWLKELKDLGYDPGVFFFLTHLACFLSKIAKITHSCK